MSADADPLLTLDEVSELLRVPAGTLYSWRSEGKGPTSFKHGRRVLYRTSAVQEYRKRQEAETSSDLRAS